MVRDLEFGGPASGITTAFEVMVRRAGLVRIPRPGVGAEQCISAPEESPASSVSARWLPYLFATGHPAGLFSFTR